MDTGQTWGEERSELAPKHPSPGVVGLEYGVQPVQLHLAELRVVEEPPPVLRLQSLAGP